MKQVFWLFWFSAVALFPSQAQQPMYVASQGQHRCRRENHRLTITNRRIVEDGSTDHSYNSTPAVVETWRGDYVLSYRKGIGHSNSPWIILRHSSDHGATWGPELFQWNTTSLDPTLAKTPLAGDLMIEFG